MKQLCVLTEKCVGSLGRCVSMVGPLRFIMLRLTWCGVTLLMSLRVLLFRKVLWWLTCLVSFGRLVKHGRRVGLVMKPLTSRWHEAAAGLVHLAQDRVMSLAPMTEELWRSTVRAKPMRTSTGLDGLSRADMLAMPSDLLQLILQLCSHAEQTGRWPRQAVLGVVSALETETVGDYRPITVLSLLYRTWSSAYLSEFAPASMYGNLSCRSLAVVVPPAASA